MKLEKLVLVRFTEDQAVIPSISAWFGALDSNMADEITMEKLPIYKNLPLEILNSTGKLHLKKINGGHLEMSPTVFRYFIYRYLLSR